MPVNGNVYPIELEKAAEVFKEYFTTVVVN